MLIKDGLTSPCLVLAMRLLARESKEAFFPELELLLMLCGMQILGVAPVLPHPRRVRRLSTLQAKPLSGYGQKTQLHLAVVRRPWRIFLLG